MVREFPPVKVVPAVTAFTNTR